MSQREQQQITQLQRELVALERQLKDAVDGRAVAQQYVRVLNQAMAEHHHAYAAQIRILTDLAGLRIFGVEKA